jgi:mannosyl-oligosaccharide glucosidase
MIRKLTSSETGLFTEYGVRSLSIYDPYYRLGDNYWTSPIWMNINFLIASSLYSYSNNNLVEP